MRVVISGEGLTIAQIGAVARGAQVALSDDPAVLARVAKSREQIRGAVARGEQIYGVSTLFGGMADQYVGPELLVDVQRLALWQHKSTAGPRLPAGDVRAAMLLRANSLIKGVSGIRLEIIERFATFLNAGATPHVYQRGSIGASGDLVPLAISAGAIMGLDPAFKVDLDGETLDCHTALRRLGPRAARVRAQGGPGAQQRHRRLHRRRVQRDRPRARSGRGQPRRQCADRPGDALHRPELRALHPCREAAPRQVLDRAADGPAGQGIAADPRRGRRRARATAWAS
ncbi:MAG: aromatic amino acid lyase [Sphingomonas sp.]